MTWKKRTGHLSQKHQERWSTSDDCEKKQQKEQKKWNPKGTLLEKKALELGRKVSRTFKYVSV